MKKIFMLAIVSTILFSVSAQKKDTCCPCVSQPKQTKKVPTSPRPWRYVETIGKGLITESFNDSIVIEDYSGVTTLTVIPERFFPPSVSNLKEVNGSFNRHISIKKMPPVPVKNHCYHEDWFWIPVLLLLGLLALIAYLFTRGQQTNPVTIHNNIPPTPPATPGHRTAVTPGVDMKEVYDRAEATGSTVVVHADGGIKIIPPVKKEDKSDLPVADVKGTKKGEEKEEKQ